MSQYLVGQGSYQWPNCRVHNTRLTSGVEWDTPFGLCCLGCCPVNYYWFPLACADPTPTWVIIKPFPCDDTALRFHQLSFSLMNVPCAATPSPCDIHTGLRVLVSLRALALCGYNSTSKLWLHALFPCPPTANQGYTFCAIIHECWCRPWWCLERSMQIPKGQTLFRGYIDFVVRMRSPSVRGVNKWRWHGWRGRKEWCWFPDTVKCHISYSPSEQITLCTVVT